MTKQTPFCCPICGCTSYELHQRPGAKPAYSCHGCTILFMDQVKFTRMGKPEPPTLRDNAWGEGDRRECGEWY